MDIQKHYDSIEKSFSLAIKSAPGKKQRKEIVQKAKQVCKELARFYGYETRKMYCMGESLGKGYRKQFAELGKKLGGMYKK